MPRKASPPAGSNGIVILMLGGCCGYALITDEMPWGQKLLLAFAGTFGLLLGWVRVSGGQVGRSLANLAWRDAEGR